MLCIDLLSWKTLRSSQPEIKTGQWRLSSTSNSTILSLFKDCYNTLVFKNILDEVHVCYKCIVSDKYMFLPLPIMLFFFLQKHFLCTIAKHVREKGEKKISAVFWKQTNVYLFRGKKNNPSYLWKTAGLIQNKYFGGLCMWASAKSCWFAKNNNWEYFL